MTMTMINDWPLSQTMPIYNDYDYDNDCIAVFLIHLNILGVHHWNPLMKYKKKTIEGNNIVKNCFKILVSYWRDKPECSNWPLRRSVLRETCAISHRCLVLPSSPTLWKWQHRRPGHVVRQLTWRWSPSPWWTRCSGSPWTSACCGGGTGGSVQDRFLTIFLWTVKGKFTQKP